MRVFRFMMSCRNKWVFSVAVFILAAGCKKKCEENISFLPEDFHRAYENVETLVYEVKDTVWPFTIDTFTLVKTYDRDQFVEFENEDDCISYKQAHAVSFWSDDGLMGFNHFLAMPEGEDGVVQLGMYLDINISHLIVWGTDFIPKETLSLSTSGWSGSSGAIKFSPDSGFVWALYEYKIVKRLE